MSILDLGNEAERLPVLTASGAKWIGWCDFTSPANLSLVSSSDVGLPTPPALPSASSSGIVNRIAAAFNKFGSAVSGNMPDLTAPPLATSYYGPKFRAVHTNARGGAYFDANERGLSTPPATFTMATPGAMATADAVTLACTGTFPTLGNVIMNATTTYYLIKRADGTFQLASTAANAAAGAFVPLSSPGSGTLTFTDSTKSLTSTATMNWFGLPMSSGQIYSFVDVLTIDRNHFRPLSGTAGLGGGDFTNQPWMSISSVGSIWLGIGGAGNSTAANKGRLGCNIRRTYNGQVAMESANVGVPSAATYDAQLLVIVRVMQTNGASSGNGASVKHYINGAASTQQGDLYAVPAEPLCQIVVGDGAAWQGVPLRSGHTQHDFCVIQGAVNVADVAAITAFFDARMGHALAKAGSRAPQSVPPTHGQSNGDNRNGSANSALYSGTVTTPGGLVLTNAQNTVGGNVALQAGEDVWAGLTGTAAVYQDYGRGTVSPLSAATPSRTLLCSEAPWGSSTAVGTTTTGFIDDCSGNVTPGTASTYQLDTHTGSAGANLTAYYAGLAANGAPMPKAFNWVQGENSALAWSGSVYNKDVSGSPYAGSTLEQCCGRYVQGLGLLQGFVTGLAAASATLPIGLQHIVSVSGGTSLQHTALMAADQIYVDQNPGKALFVNANPWHHTGLPGLHYESFTYEYLAAETSRVWTWWFKQLGTLYVEGAAGPAYGQFPRLSSVSAVAGNSYVDVTITNPNGATTLLLSGSGPLLGWAVRTGTTTTAISTAGAVAGSMLSGAAGTYEKGGTALTITGATLLAPFKVRLALSTGLAAGTKVTVFYGDAITMDAANTGSYPRSPDPFQSMLTDNSGSVFAGAEPLLQAFYRGRHMPVAVEACGLAVTP